MQGWFTYNLLPANVYLCECYLLLLFDRRSYLIMQAWQISFIINIHVIVVQGSSKYVYKVNLKHPITAAGNPNTFVFRTDMNCNNNSVINIPPTQQHAVLANLVPLHIPCTGAGHVSDENILKFSNDSNPTQSNELVIGGEYLPVQGNGVMQLAPGTMLLTSCLPNSNNTGIITGDVVLSL